MNFGSGTSASFGAGITVEQTTTLSSTELTATVVIAEDAALGARDVTVANPSGESATCPAVFVVTLPPPSLSLGYEGKQRDRVGKGNSLTAPGRPAGRHLQGHRRVRQRPAPSPARALDTQRQRSLGHHHDHYPMDGRCRQRARQHPPQRQQRHGQLCHHRRTELLPLRPRPHPKRLHPRRPGPRPGPPRRRLQHDGRHDAR